MFAHDPPGMSSNWRSEAAGYRPYVKDQDHCSWATAYSKDIWDLFNFNRPKNVLFPLIFDDLHLGDGFFYKKP